ncbi:MAG: AAA family ATPase [Nannocystaceae bacterium]
MQDLPAAAAHLRAILERACAGLVQREVAVQLIVLGAVAGEHVLLIGPPGTAKSEAARRVARGLGGRFFEYLVGRFTEPSELFGPVDLEKLRRGVVETRTAGMLPEADVAFLDEVFLGSTAILNTLLGILNERSFRRGHTTLRCPLRVCVGAANQLPDDPALAAFADRFLLHLFLEPIADPYLESLLEAGWSQPALIPGGAEELAALDVLIAAARDVDVLAVRAHLSEAVRILRGAGIEMTDRRVVKLQRLIAAAATLDGRAQATGADLWPIVFAIADPSSQERARELLRDTLAAARSAAVGAAAEHASLGPLARADRLCRSARALLDVDPGDEPVARRRWRLKLEGVAREIDAGFARASLPDALAEVRSELVARLGEAPVAAPPT